MMNGHDDIGRARSALFALDPSCTHDEWVRSLMAARAANIDVNTVREWSAQADSYRETEFESTWRSIKPEAGIGAGTLFWAAKEVGWIDPQAPQNGAYAGHASDVITNGRVNPQAAQKPAPDLGVTFDGYPAAGADHPYIVAKRGNPDGLRVVPADDPMMIRGKRVAGSLVVPVCSLDGALRTAQFIPPAACGDKLNAPGASFGDGVFIVGAIVPDGTIHVVEGMGQGWACAKADYHAAAVVAFGSGRVRAIAKLLRGRYPAARIVIVSDKGKEADAEAIARDIGGAWVAMPADAPGNYDANDYEADCGPDALAGLLRAAKTPPMRYKLLSSDDLLSAPPLRWFVRGVLPADSFAALYGPSGSGKSFLALDLCAAVAEGADWFGRRVVRAPVTYCALEGERGMGKRTQAWSARNGRPLPANFRFIAQPLDLRSEEDVHDLANAVIAGGGENGLLVIDTLNRAAPGGDENSSADMGALIAACKELQRRTRCTVLLVHHTGKDSTKGLRGHSSLFAALDAAIEVSRTDARREWAVAKSKDDADGDKNAFELRAIDVGKDEDGEPVTSCVVVPAGSTALVERVKLPQGANQQIALNALAQPLRESRNFNKGDAPYGRPYLDIEVAVPIVAAHLTCEPKRRNERAREAINGLVARQIYGAKDGWLWRM
ncbi:AAA family ATPase [Paraburkholderia sediminicola]|uniref:AAA family ATPase n=1 Tax=Paraburkholderia sediminicola TaxID=458836 RepID=UPI0038BB41C0